MMQILYIQNIIIKYQLCKNMMVLGPFSFFPLFQLLTFERAMNLNLQLFSKLPLQNMAYPPLSMILYMVISPLFYRG